MTEVAIPKEIVQNSRPQRTKSGYTLTCIHESETGFIYEERYNRTGNVHGYEVFKRIPYESFTIAGKVFPAGVRYPGNEDFGKWAWSPRTLERAYEILERLN